ncbi:MAG TPA: histidine kinase N-terminal 7TM domain-containing protein [Candidatus Limnocylindrales bacterium]|nr:histidine kinase N-terminal 7TM domain-containing protein [Candidatus Limnocylindrales bacterium]
MYFNPFALIYYSAALLALKIAISTWNIESVRGAREFSFLALASAVYTFFYGLEISSFDLRMVMFWIRLEYFGIPFIAPALLSFTLKYTGRIKKFTMTWIAGLLVIPVITIILVHTNEAHGLIYRSYQLETIGLFTVLVFEPGGWYWVNVANIALSVLISNILLLIMWLNSKYLFRKQVTVIFFSSLVPFFGFIIYVTRIFGVIIDIIPLLLTVSTIIIYWGLTRYDLFDLVPFARNRLFEELPEGVLVIDSRLRVVDFNATAIRLLDLEPGSIGKPAATALQVWPKLAENIKPMSEGYHLELQQEIADKTHWFNAEFTPIFDDATMIMSQMVIIRDITDRRLAEDNLRLMAATDYLTGLWNRRHFMQSAEKELKRAARYKRLFSLIVMDLDHFKL